ncbi:uncharacterized protein LOC111079246 [Drosophila obscura]|uniref:uncharacterized protein LOC111079246 n=1 Tax=Drosophila obscura TaxID=7282 RepID=UPI001BB1D4AD|nr:uncharacterized protein LOC111079246 [Drosophila obscura]
MGTSLGKFLNRSPECHFNGYRKFLRSYKQKHSELSQQQANLQAAQNWGKLSTSQKMSFVDVANTNYDKLDMGNRTKARSRRRSNKKRGGALGVKNSTSSVKNSASTVLNLIENADIGVPASTDLNLMENADSRFPNFMNQYRLAHAELTASDLHLKGCNAWRALTEQQKSLFKDSPSNAELLEHCTCSPRDSC